MCAHYESVKDPKRLAQAFGVQPVAGVKDDVWPTYTSTFVRRPREAGGEAVPEREAVAGSFGLIPHWAQDTRIARQTYNARSETVGEKASFRDAWRLGRFCIIPAEAIYEPDWRSGKAEPRRISRADGQPMGLAGIWTGWRSPQGEVLRSFSMLTIAADQHPLMSQFNRPEDEKRMVVVLPEHAYAAWLRATAIEAAVYLRPYPAQGLRLEA
ncbi:MAG: SOS response-associated peptidase [Curvibacter sp.]|nr:SOS response-associated peptidase [Curvibacter sp.]